MYTYLRNKVLKEEKNQYIITYTIKCPQKHSCLISTSFSPCIRNSQTLLLQAFFRKMESNIYNALYILKKVRGWPKKYTLEKTRYTSFSSYFDRGLKSVEIFPKYWKTTELCHKNLSKWEQSQFGPNVKVFVAQISNFSIFLNLYLVF